MARTVPKKDPNIESTPVRNMPFNLNNSLSTVFLVYRSTVFSCLQILSRCGTPKLTLIPSPVSPRLMFKAHHNRIGIEWYYQMFEPYFTSPVIVGDPLTQEACHSNDQCPNSLFKASKICFLIDVFGMHSLFLPSLNEALDRIMHCSLCGVVCLPFSQISVSKAHKYEENCKEVFYCPFQELHAINCGNKEKEKKGIVKEWFLIHHQRKLLKNKIAKRWNHLRAFCINTTQRSQVLCKEKSGILSLTLE